MFRKEIREILFRLVRPDCFYDEHEIFTMFESFADIPEEDLGPSVSRYPLPIWKSQILDELADVFVHKAPSNGDPTQYSWAASEKPAGSKIVFLSGRYNIEPLGSCRGTSEIYVMDADGSNQTRLTNNCAEEGRPSWRPAR